MDKELLRISHLYEKKASELNVPSIHMPDVINFLQGMGFYISRVDGCHPDDTHPLKDNQKGIRIIISCNHSGQRYYLEKPSKVCSCVKSFDSDSKDTFWEVMGVQPSTSKNSSFIESGSDLIPSVSESMKNIIFRVTNGLNLLLHEDQRIHNAIETKRKSLAVKSPEMGKRTSVSETAIPQAVEQTSVPKIRVTKSLRYGSLDTLINTSSSNLKSSASKPPNVKSDSSVYISSEDLVSVLNNSRSSIAESDRENVLDLLKTASGNILAVISQMELTSLNQHSDKFQTSNESLNSLPSGVSLPSRSVSSPTLLKPPSGIAEKKTSSKSKAPLAPGKSRKSSTSSIKSTKSETKPELKKSNSTVSKKQVKVSEGKETKLAKRASNLYAHVKSTIPKPRPKKT